VEIRNFDLCPRYSALVFENVTVGPSPQWLQNRLEAIRLNPINNIVDVTNYVMAEIAQPMHAFDADKLNGSIIVRTAEARERLLALNGETYELNSSNLVIADRTGAVALAGIIGGGESAIFQGTKRIVLESANFNAANVRRTSAALRLRTDASMRFEKAQDPVNTVRGLARALQLLQEVSPGIRVTGGVADALRPLPEAPVIDLPLAWLDRKLGRHVEPSEVRRILESLEFGIEEKQPQLLSVSVPSWRATKDISVKDDLVEEVGRMIGYTSITPHSPLLPATVPLSNEKMRFQYRTREVVAAQGFNEVENYSFVSEETARLFGMPPESHVRVLNPIAADQGLLRRSLVPGIWKNIVENSRFEDVFRLFEIGVEIHKTESGLPDEVAHLCAALYQEDGDWGGLLELKRLAQCLNANLDVRPAEAHSYEHPARTASVILHNETIGRLFEMHPALVRGRAAVLDLNLDRLMQLTQADRRYQPVRRFPSSAFDLSVIAGQRALVGQIQREITVLAGEDLEHIEYVRQYTGPPLPEDTKSVSYRVTVSASDRTLSSNEVSAIRQRIIDGMRSLGYELRV
jgi:phenylalanyl-tRNA synthetase beta chain